MSYDSSEEASSRNTRQATTTSEDSEGTHDDVATPRSASSNPNPGNIDSGMLESCLFFIQMPQKVFKNIQNSAMRKKTVFENEKFLQGLK